MKRTIKVGDAPAINNLLSELFEATQIGWYAIRRNAKRLSPLLEEIEAERTAIVNELCEKDEDGSAIITEEKNYKFSEDNESKANELFKSFLQEEVEVNFYDMKMEEFKDVDKDIVTKKVFPLVGIIVIDEDDQNFYTKPKSVKERNKLEAVK